MRTPRRPQPSPRRFAGVGLRFFRAGGAAAVVTGFALLAWAWGVARSAFEFAFYGG